MAFVVNYNQDTPQDCYQCPLSSFVSHECLYCPARREYVRPEKNKRPAGCTIREEKPNAVNNS